VPAMTVERYRRFLSEGTRTAKVVTVRADGRPHVVPVWFLLDDDSLVFTTGKTSVKGRNLRRDPRVMVCVDDETMPYAMVAVQGTASLSEDADALLDWAMRITRRYVGPERAGAIYRPGRPSFPLCVSVKQLRAT
jgi:PPOX class probable F420-dependent enzyme